MKKTAIYARVSTNDKDQNPETQLRELRQYAKSRGFKVVAEHVDFGTGKKSDRKEYQTLLTSVKKRQVDVVLVWRYDRFARSTRELVNQLEEFHSLGVDFVSLSEGTDTTTPQGKLVFTIMAGLAEFESALIGERVRAGMARAKAEGKRVSKPSIPKEKMRRIKTLRKEGWTYRAISKELGVSVGSVVKYS